MALQAVDQLLSREACVDHQLVRPSVKAATLGAFLQRTDVSRCGKSGRFSGGLSRLWLAERLLSGPVREIEHDSRLAEG
jgi:hypothetical protein